MVDLVLVMTDEPHAGDLVGLMLADEEGGYPAEVIGRVLSTHHEAISTLPGGKGLATWQPGTSMACTYNVTWESAV